MDELVQLKAYIERQTRGLRAEHGEMTGDWTYCDWVDLLGQLARGEIERAEAVVVVKREA